MDRLILQSMLWRQDERTKCEEEGQGAGERGSKFHFHFSLGTPALQAKLDHQWSSCGTRAIGGFPVVHVARGTMGNQALKCEMYIFEKGAGQLYRVGEIDEEICNFNSKPNKMYGR